MNPNSGVYFDSCNSQQVQQPQLCIPETERCRFGHQHYRTSATTNASALFITLMLLFFSLQTIYCSKVSWQGRLPFSELFQPKYKCKGSVLTYDFLKWMDGWIKRWKHFSIFSSLFLPKAGKLFTLHFPACVRLKKQKKTLSGHNTETLAAPYPRQQLSRISDEDAPVDFNISSP